MPTANEMQVGGTHYKGEYQHWDLVLDTGMGYLEGCATKYVSRHRKKGGDEDLKKALHYTNKLIEAALAQRARPPWYARRAEVGARASVAELCRKFADVNKLTALEEAAVMALADWGTAARLRHARDLILKLLEESDYSNVVADAKPVPLEDSNKHGERAEELPGKSCFKQEE